MSEDVVGSATPEYTGTSVQLIRMADGTLIDPQSREPVGGRFQNKKSATKSVEEFIEEALEAGDDEDDEDENADINIAPLSRRSMYDLTLSHAQMAVVNNVLVYTLWGLPDDEIAMVCKCSTPDVHVIRNLDEYKRMYEALVEGMKASLNSTVQGIFALAAPKAAKGIIKKMKNKSVDISMAAQKDVLDRAGHRPSDRVEHTHNFGVEGLKIKIVRESEAPKIPTLDLSANA